MPSSACKHRPSSSTARALELLGAVFLLYLALSLAVGSPGVHRWDVTITRLLQAGRSPFIDHIARAFTMLGSGPVLIICAAASSIIFTALKKPRSSIACLLVLLSFPLNALLKLVQQRPRPEQGLVDVLAPSVGCSFPSGHSMGAVIVFGFIAIMVWVHVPGRASRATLTALLWLLVLAIGLSRVYLGVHWITDVLGGWAAGLFVLTLLALFYRRFASAETPPPPEARVNQRAV